MNKEGAVLTMSVIVKIIILIAGTALVLVAIRGFWLELGEKDTEIICEQSVNIKSRSAINIGSLEEVKFTPLLCQTQDKELKGDKEEVMKELAKLTARCWKMFAQGRTEAIFQNVPGIVGNNQGFVCYTALLRDIADADYITGREFVEFLGEKEHPNYAGSYLDYIQKSGGPGRLLMLLRADKDNRPLFREGIGYEIAYIEKNVEGKNNWLAPVLAGGGLATAGVGVAMLAVGGPVTIVAGVGVIGAGAIASTVGTKEVLEREGVLEKDQLDNIFRETDVSTIVIADVSDINTSIRLHNDVFIGDLGGS